MNRFRARLIGVCVVVGAAVFGLAGRADAANPYIQNAQFGQDEGGDYISFDWVGIPNAGQECVTDKIIIWFNRENPETVSEGSFYSNRNVEGDFHTYGFISYSGYGQNAASFASGFPAGGTCGSTGPDLSTQLPRTIKAYLNPLYPPGRTSFSGDDFITIQLLGNYFRNTLLWFLLSDDTERYYYRVPQNPVPLPPYENVRFGFDELNRLNVEFDWTGPSRTNAAMVVGFNGQVAFARSSTPGAEFFADYSKDVSMNWELCCNNNIAYASWLLWPGSSLIKGEHYKLIVEELHIWRPYIGLWKCSNFYPCPVSSYLFQFVAGRDLLPDDYITIAFISPNYALDGIVKYYFLDDTPRIATSTMVMFKSDGVTSLAPGEQTMEDEIVLAAQVESPIGRDVELETEVKPLGTPFTGAENIYSSNFVSSTATATIAVTGLANDEYHWRARAVDSSDRKSDWVEFGDTGDVDFFVKNLGQAAAALAKELVNYPYLWGGKGWDFRERQFASVSAVQAGYSFWNPEIRKVDVGAGVDCSGLIMWAFNRSFDPEKRWINNFVKYEGADGQYRNNTTSTTEAELKPGDVMFFDWDSNNFMDHVAMYVGGSSDKDVVNASNRDKGIVAASKDTLKSLTGFREFKRVISSDPPAVLVTAHSPVDIEVTDPSGFTITPATIIPSETEYLREIPGVLYYTEIEQGEDGNPVDQVYSPLLKTGDYLVKVLPATGTSPAVTYSLEFTTGSSSISLADNVPVDQIPRNGYGVAVSATGTASSFIPVRIDIKPGSSNTVNLSSNGVVPFVIFGSPEFDVQQIDPFSVKLINAPIRFKPNGQPLVSYSDINNDSYTDMIAQIPTETLRLALPNAKINLEGKLINGVDIKGSSIVRTVP